MGAIIKQCSKN